MSTSSVERIRERLAMLGLHCEEVPLDRSSSAISALACFPMYMVANVHGWMADRQFKVPLVDIPGSEAIRESVTIGAQEGRLNISGEHSTVVGSMLSPVRPPDQVVYQYALETLQEYLVLAMPKVADELRTSVARMVAAVAKASGKRIFGSGEKVSSAERACIDHIASKLRLSESASAAEILNTIGPA